MTDEKLNQIQNMLKQCRLISEINDVEANARGLTNIMAVPKTRVE
jgi:hypothetical protein